MFASVEVATGKPERLITLPQTAIVYAPYRRFGVHRAKARQRRLQSALGVGFVARQTFVRLGAKRGDEVAVLEGVPEGATVVTAGQIKLQERRADEDRRKRAAAGRSRSQARGSINGDSPMRFTDIFVRRPVLATVVSLLILVLGLRSLATLPILEYPRTQNAVVTVTTQYFGADPRPSPASSRRRWKTPSPRRTASIISPRPARSARARSPPISGSIMIPARALTEISTKINSVINQLPAAVQRPTIAVKIGQTTDAMYIGFSSDVLIAEPGHGLSDPRRSAAPAIRARRADGRTHRRQDIRVARVARSDQARRLWPDGERTVRGAVGQRLHRRSRLRPRARWCR